MTLTGHGDADADAATQEQLGSLDVHFDKVNLAANSASFIASEGQHSIELPLDQIVTVWKRKSRGGQTSWEVSLAGWLQDGDRDGWLFWPQER